MANVPGKLFGRKWQIAVTLDDGESVMVSDSDFDPAALRAVFEIDRPGYQAIYYADLDIYNMTQDLDRRIILGAKSVIISAGYQNGAFGVVFEGEVFQHLYEREGTVDYKVSLRCIDGDTMINNNFISLSVDARYTEQRQVIRQMAERARTPIPMGDVTDDLQAGTLARGKVFFGDPKHYLRQYAQDNNAQFWMNEGKLEISKITDESEEMIVLSPQSGLIGTPQLVNEGVAFRCLLNPGIRITNPAMKVKLDQTVIRQEKVKMMQHITLLDQDGIYKVARVRHLGDTRGNDWYTEVVAVGSPGAIPLLLDTKEQTANGG